MRTTSALTVCRPKASIACGSIATFVPALVVMRKNDCPSQRMVSGLSAAKAGTAIDAVTRRPANQRLMMSFPQKPFHERIARLEAQLARGAGVFIIRGLPARLDAGAAD